MYNLPDLNSVEKIFTGNKLHKIGISPDCKHLWGIDDQHYLGIWNIDKVNKTYSDMKGENFQNLRKMMYGLLYGLKMTQIHLHLHKKICSTFIKISNQKKF